MKALYTILFAVLVSGCSEPPASQQTDDRPTIAVSIPPQAGLLRAIVGEQVDILTLVGEGQSPHAYEPSARQLARLAEAELLLTIGVPFEERLLQKIRPLYPELTLVRTQAGIPLRAMPHVHHGEACTHEHGAKDPHVWLDPDNARTIADNMLQALTNALPQQAEIFTAHAALLQDRLDKLDQSIAESLKPLAGSRFYVFHPSFGYFADAYGLHQVPVELDGKSPSPRQLTTLIEQARADGVKIIFVQQQFPQDSARAVAEAIDGEVVALDPLAEDLENNLRIIAERIVKALEK